MLIYENNRYIVDPHYLSIIPLRKIWDRDTTIKKEVAHAALTWLYHMYNPHSPFRDYRNATKSTEIVMATFPKWYMDEKEKELEEKIKDATRKNKDAEDQMIDVDEAGDKKKPAKEVNLVTIPKLKPYDPEEDPDMEEAIKWYKTHLRKTALWTAYDSYKEAIYNLSKIVANPDSSAQEIRTASNELHTLPKKMEEMRQQAAKDEANTAQVAGDKSIRRGERLPADIKRESRKV